LKLGRRGLAMVLFVIPAVLLALGGPTAPSAFAAPSPLKVFPHAVAAPTSVAVISTGGVFPPDVPQIGFNFNLSYPSVTFLGAVYPDLTTGPDANIFAFDLTNPGLTGSIDSYQIWVQMPNAGPLAPGDYKNVGLVGGQVPGQAGLSVFPGPPGNGNGACLGAGGSFHVDDATYSGSQLTSFAMSFTQVCPGATSSVTGWLLYHSSAWALSNSYQGYLQVSGGGDGLASGMSMYVGGPQQFNQQVVGSAVTPDGGGYWLVASDGGIFSFGDAAFYGSTGNIALNRPIVAMASTSDGGGYWLVSSDGGIFSFGDAGFYGSTGNVALNQPIVGMASTPDGGGYWLVASDGGIFSFGDAGFYGSTGNIALNQPIVGMASTPDGKGYWLVARDGGVFCFGDAAFYGSTGSIPLVQPIVGLAPTPTGNGYWLSAADGGVFSFGSAQYLGSASALQTGETWLGLSAFPF
jgi:hypothetical protein